MKEKSANVLNEFRKKYDRAYSIGVFNLAYVLGILKGIHNFFTIHT